MALHAAGRPVASVASVERMPHLHGADAPSVPAPAEARGTQRLPWIRRRWNAALSEYGTVSCPIAARPDGSVVAQNERITLERRRRSVFVRRTALTVVRRRLSSHVRGSREISFRNRLVVRID